MSKNWYEDNISLRRRNTIWDTAIKTSVLRERRGESDQPVGDDPDAGEKREHNVPSHLNTLLDRSAVLNFNFNIALLNKELRAFYHVNRRIVLRIALPGYIYEDVMLTNSYIGV